jgi:hypothetical protein
LCAALAAGLLGVADAHAAPLDAACANPEIVVEAKPVEINYRDNSTVLRDPLTIRQCDNRIEAAEARSTGGIAFENSRWDVLSARCASGPALANLSSDKAVVEFRNNLISEAVVTGTPPSSSSSATTAAPRAGTPTRSPTKRWAAGSPCAEKRLALGRLQRDHRPAAGLQHHASRSRRPGALEHHADG